MSSGLSKVLQKQKKSFTLYHTAVYSAICIIVISMISFFDTVWTNALISKISLAEIGLEGRAWLSLYKAYYEFRC